MIAKIFPTINNIAPYKSKVHKPYFDIYFSDTPYTVKSHGFDTTFYTFATVYNSPALNDSSIKWICNTPLIKYYTGKGYPSEIASEFYTSKQFVIKYSGYFTASSSTATFSFLGTGKINVKFNSNSVIATTNLSISTATFCYLSGLIPGSQYLTEINYISPGKTSNKSNVFVAKWKDATIPQYLPMSAGYFCSTDNHSNPITATKLNHIMETNLDISHNKITQFTFIVPIVQATASVGYKYNPDYDYYEDIQDSNKKIKKFTMIEYYTGYSYPDSSISTVARFVGQVRGWDVKRGNQDTLEVTCEDWGCFLQDHMNNAYPDVSDYLTFDYLTDDVIGPAGGSKPRTYDAWKLSDAVDNLLINSYIDPKLLVQKNKVLDVDDTVSNIYYTIHDKNLSSHIYLDKQFNYGNSVSVDNTTDDEYLWQFSIGDAIIDNVQKIMDNYGFNYGFNNYGNFYTNSVKNPIKVKSADDMTFSGTWSEYQDVKSLYGFTNETSVISASVVATFVGVASKLIFNVDSTFGSIQIRLSNPTLGLIATGTYSLYNSSSRSYFDGVDNTLGYNPCMLKIGEDLKYGTYSLTIINKTTSSININALFIYNVDQDKEVDTFYTGDYNSNTGLITDLGSSSFVNDIRNDVIVIGKSKGIKSILSLTDEGNEIIVNPNNPVNQYVMARVIDRASIGSISYNNYTGRPLQMYIIEPSVGADDRAEWLASETVKRYNQFKKSIQPNITIIGNPLLEVYDKIKIKDVKINSIPTAYNFWVSSINEKHKSNGEFITDLSIESFEPWESYYKYPIPSLSRFNDTVFKNVTFYNTGLPPESSNFQQVLFASYTDATMSAEYYRIGLATMLDSELINMIPEQGYIKINKEIIKYNNIEIKNLYKRLDLGSNVYTATLNFGELTRGMFSTATTTGTVLDDVLSKQIEVGIDPYITEEFGIVPAVQFDLLYSGFVHISVVDSNGVLVDVLTGDESPSLDKGWVYLKPGTHYYSWGMIDRVGSHNEVNSGAHEYAGGDDDVPYKSRSLLGDWKDYGSYSYGQTYKIGQGYYVQNQKWCKNSRFTITLRYIDSNMDLLNVQDFTSNYNKPVYSIIRSKGNSLALAGNESYGRVYIHDDSTLDSSEIRNDWWNEYLQRDVSTDIFSETRKYYTGNENFGKGLKVILKNKYDVPRICQIKISRYIYTLFYFYGNTSTDHSVNMEKSYTKVRDKLVEEYISDFTHIINNSGQVIYIPAPKVNFLTKNLLASINYWTSGDIDSAYYDGYYDYPHVLGVSHVHFFKITVIDYSGRESAYRFKLFWVPYNFINTESVPEKYQSPFVGLDGKIYYYNAMRFLPRGEYGESNQVIPLDMGDALAWPYGVYDASQSDKTNKPFFHCDEVLGIAVYGQWE